MLLLLSFPWKWESHNQLVKIPAFLPACRRQRLWPPETGRHGAGMTFVNPFWDTLIYTKTKATARKVGNAIFKFLKKKLKLTINREKSGIRRPVHFTVLGFGFVPTYVKGAKGKYQLVVSDKSWKKLKQKLKTITRKTTPMSFDERIQKLNEVQRGWVKNCSKSNFRYNYYAGKIEEAGLHLSTQYLQPNCPTT